MDFDVIVVGAGPAGALCARDLAKSGCIVGLFDASSRDKLSKTLIVEAENSVFPKTGVEPPKGKDIPYHPKRVRVFSGNRKFGYMAVNEDQPVAFRLDWLANKLLAEAEKAGAKFFEKYRAKTALVEDGQVCGVSFMHGRKKQDVNAKLVIDATGFDATLVKGLDPSLGMEYRDDDNDVVIAANYLHDIKPKAAKEAIAKGLQGDEETWASISRHSNYSTEFSYLSLAKKCAYILIGIKQNWDGPPIEDLFDDFRERQGYFGKKLYGGKAPIRIDNSLPRLVTNGFMVIGEAACTVIPLLGSGVGSALLTGQMAAKVGAAALKRGDVSTGTLWPYAAEYQRGRGAILANQNAMRLLTEKITNQQAIAMMESGISAKEDLINYGIPSPMSASLESLPGRAMGLLKNLDMLPQFVKTGVVGGMILRHYKNYPLTWNKQTFTAWKNKSDKLFSYLR